MKKLIISVVSFVFILSSIIFYVSTASAETTIPTNEQGESIKEGQISEQPSEKINNLKILGNSAIVAENERNVSSWRDFVDALKNKKINIINIQADFYNTKRFSGLEDATSIPSRSIKINGNNHIIDFRAMKFYNANAIKKGQNTKWQMNDLTMYGQNYYGPFKGICNDGKADNAVIQYNNVNYTGAQLTASYDWGIEFAGDVINQSVNEYQSPFDGKVYRTLSNQENIEAAAITFKKNSHYQGTTQNAGVLIVGYKGNIILEDYATVDLTSGGKGGGYEAYAVKLEGSLTANTHSNLTINTKKESAQYAIYFTCNYGGLAIKPQANVTINSNGKGTREALFFKWHGFIVIDGEGQLNINGFNRGANTSSLIRMLCYSQIIVKENGILNVKSDADGSGSYKLIHLDPHSTVEFTNAKKVNLQFVLPKQKSTVNTRTFTNGTKKRNIFYMDASLKVKEQDLKAWNMNQLDANEHSKSTYQWTMLKSMDSKFYYTKALKNYAVSSNENVKNSFIINFNANDYSRLLYTNGTTLEMNLLNEPNDNEKDVNATVLKGRTEPGALVRVTGDPALPKPAVSSGITNSQDPNITDDYTVQADKNGDFEVYTVSGQYFSAANELTVFAYLNGKNTSEIVDIQDKTAPTASSVNLFSLAGKKLPGPSLFTENVKDKPNKVNEVFYEFKEDYSKIMNQKGEYTVEVIVSDAAGNKSIVRSKMYIYDEEYSIEANDSVITLDELKQNNTDDLLKAVVLKKSNATGKITKLFEEIDCTNQIKIKDLSELKAQKEGIYNIVLTLGNPSDFNFYTKEIKIKVAKNAKDKIIGVSDAKLNSQSLEKVARSKGKENPAKKLIVSRNSGQGNYNAHKDSAIVKVAATALDINLLDEVNDNESIPNSSIVKGKTSPGALVRVTGDPALPIPSLSSGMSGSSDPLLSKNFTVKADANGYFEVKTQQGKYLTAINNLTIFTYLNGQQLTKTVEIMDKTAPIGSGLSLAIVKGENLPAAEKFLENVKDKLNKNMTKNYAFSEDYSALTGIVGSHPIQVILSDAYGNSSIIPASFDTYSTKYRILSRNFVIPLSELKQLTTEDELKNMLLHKGELNVLSVEDFVLQSRLSRLSILDANQLVDYKSGIYQIHMEAGRGFDNDKYITKGNVFVTVINNEQVKPSKPDNPGGGEPDEKENEGTGESGLLKLDYAPSTFDFGVVKYGFDSINVRAIKTTSSKQWIQVSDDRVKDSSKNEIKNWSIQVAQNHPLATAAGKELKGATITIPKGKTYNQLTKNQEVTDISKLSSNEVTISSTPTTIFEADNSFYSMQYISTNVWDATDVKLHIPGNQNIDFTNYTNTINWSLVAEP
ncbi:MAG: WxL domain-containing protein [Kurthia sp.]|nr:WxL domain-containing protein [Candidatus Kurthia equi]